MTRRALMLTPDEGYLDRRIAQEAASLAANGWQVDIHPSVDRDLQFEDDFPAGVRLLCAPRAATTTPGAPGGRRRLRRGLRQARQFVSRVAPVLGDLVETAQYRRRTREQDLVAAGLADLADGGAYDLLFAHDVPVFPLAARLKEAWRCPLICDLHEIFPEQDQHFRSAAARRYWRRLEAAGLARADGIMGCNDAVADYARGLGVASAPIVTVSNAVPFVPSGPRRPTLRDYYPIPVDARIVLFVGSLLPTKNLEVVIDGFGPAGLPGWVLAILGDGSLREALIHRVAAQGLQDRVFLGRHAPQKDLIALAASADLGLLPYLPLGMNYLISTPNKLYEYIQARLPIATTRLPLIERTVQAFGTGLFMDFATAASTAAGLREVVAQLGDVSADALERAAETFCWERDERVLMDLVATVMTESAARG